MTELKSGDSLPTWQPLFQNQAIWLVAKLIKSVFLWIYIPLSIISLSYSTSNSAKRPDSWPKTSDQVVPGPPAAVAQ